MRFRYLAVAVVSAVLLGGQVSSAFATPPSNDDLNAATPIVLPFHTSLDTREATTAADDRSCAGASGASVWYSFNPSADVKVDVDTFGSDYDTTLSAWTGTRGALTAIACNDDTNGVQSHISFRASAGVTYYLIAASYGYAGGNLVLNAEGSDPGPAPVPSNTFFRFTSDPDDYVGHGQTRMFTPADSSFEASMTNYDNHPSDRQFRARVFPIVGGNWYVSFAAPPGEALAPGDYPNATWIGLANDTGQPGIDISGEGRACNGSGSFTVKSLSLAPDRSIRLFDATFERHCGETGPPSVRGEILIDNRPPNAPPDCSGVIASPGEVWPPSRGFVSVALSGATDPDGESVTYTIEGVTQDEPVRSTGDRTSPDARPGGDSASVRLRAERSPKGDGRVYRIVFTVLDVRGGSCSGLATVGVPRHRHKAARDSSPPSYDSFGR
jgi:hypothetical protein